LECPSQLLQAAADPGLHGTERGAGLLGDLGVRQSLEEGHLQTLALLGAHVGEDPADLLAGTAAVGALVEAGVGRKDDISHDAGNVDVLAPAAQLVDGLVARDNGKPWAERAAGRVEGARLAPQLQENLLQDVFGLARVSENA
jgi:hypothetical protein